MNKPKIHIETVNIYYNNNDTNESIFDFLLKQQDPSKGIINFDFIYGGNYRDCFNWIIEGFTSYQKNKLDVLTYKNSKYLFYRYDDILKESNFEVKKVKHSVVTDNSIATEEIQNQNWQYFVEPVLDVFKKNDIGKTIRQPQAQLLLDTVEMLSFVKKSIKVYINILSKIYISQLKICQLKNTQRLEMTLLEKTIGQNMHLSCLIVG